MIRTPPPLQQRGSVNCLLEIAEILVTLVIVVEVVLSAAAAAQRRTVCNLLNIIQTGGYTVVARGRERIEVDGETAEATAVNLRGVHNLVLCQVDAFRK